MKKLWLATNVMVVCGIVLTFGAVVFGLGPVALVCGVLLIWSGIVKVIVLRVWRATLPAAPPRNPIETDARHTSILSEQS